MSNTEPDNNQPPAGASQPPSPRSSRALHWTMVAVPAFALLLGLLIGALVAGAGNESDGNPKATVTVTASPAVGESPDTAVVVPRECLQAAETVQQATALLRDNVSAIQDFDTDQILDVLNQLEDLTNEADEQARTCSQVELSPTDTTPAATP